MSLGDHPHTTPLPPPTDFELSLSPPPPPLKLCSVIPEALEKIPWEWTYFTNSKKRDDIDVQRAILVYFVMKKQLRKTTSSLILALTKVTNVCQVQNNLCL